MKFLNSLKVSLRSAWEEAKLLVRLLKALIIEGSAISPVGRLYATKVSADGTTLDLGLVSTKVVTDAGVAWLVGTILGTGTITDLKYHGSGTGAAAESVANTTLGTEVGTRGAGSQAVGASANIYRTIATISYSSTLAITEHGLFTASTSGTLFDRSVFAAINVINGDSIQFTYELTLPSGS